MKQFKLDNESKITTGFTTPEGYFDSFTANMISKLPGEEPKVVSIFRRKKMLYYAAAAAIVLMMLIPVYNNYSTSQEELDTVVLEDYITNHTTINDDDLAALLEKEDLEKIKLDLNLQDEQIEDILLSNPDLEQYITD